MKVSPRTPGQFKSPLYETARGLLRSRSRQAQRSRRLAEQLRQQKKINARLQSQLNAEQLQAQQLHQRLDQAERENQRLKNQGVRLPDDLPLRRHSYGARLMALSVSLAKRVGLRASADVLKIMFQWLDVPVKIPSWQNIRGWLCRLGVDDLKQSQQRHEDWIWLVDHSNQIGEEKVLTILGVRASELPAPGQTLHHSDVHLLALVPGTQWKRDDVRAQYQALQEKIGAPWMLISDGAVELRESADVLQNAGQTPIVLRDLKHFAANKLERMLGSDERYRDYVSHLGRTRSAIQQTELSHFTPPVLRTKARFMNLESILRWGTMAGWHLEHPESASRKDISAQRMQDKLGWLRQFQGDLAQWNQVQRVIDISLHVINTQGLYRGVSVELRGWINRLCPNRCERSESMAQSLIEFVAESEGQLAEGQRGWLSTEILESAFGLYKQLEGQHSKGGFTTLLASFAALLRDYTPQMIRDRLERTRVQDFKQWAKDKLGKTLTSKRTGAYREAPSERRISLELP